MENEQIEETPRYEDLREAGEAKMRHEARISETFTPAYIRDTPLVLPEVEEEEDDDGRCLDCGFLRCVCYDEPGDDDRDEFDEGRP